MPSQDVVIIGGGHNGLVTAGFLAKAGRRVLVLERRDRIGGAAITEELFPGFRFSTCADGAGYLDPEIVSQLSLETHGLEMLPSDVVAFVPRQSAPPLTIWRDTARTVAELERVSEADARRYPDFVELMRALAGVVRGLMRIPPPALPDVDFADLRRMASLAGPLRKLGRKRIDDLLRILPMPASDLLDQYFESDFVKGAIAAIAVRDVTWGPKESGTAYSLLYHWALAGNGSFRPSGAIRGGMGSLTGALAAAAGSLGAEIRTGAAVQRIVVHEGRARGVVLEGGERVEALCVVSNADPRTTFLRLLSPARAAASFVQHVRNIKYRGSAARIHLALAGLPEFQGLDPAEAPSRLAGPIQIAPSLTYLQKAYDGVKYGEASARPYLDVTIPSLLDPELAPAGHHAMSITAKFAPYALRDGSWESRGAEFLETCLDTLADYVPKLRDLILHETILTPADLEASFALPEASPHHGDMTLDQFLHMRPVPGYARYRTPVAGLYLCGAGCHPGGGVTGVPGRNAAREILAD